jgi:hypothetical protein
MEWHQGPPIDWRQVIRKSPLIMAVAASQIIAAYLIWEHIDTTLSILLTPVVAWWLYLGIVRMKWKYVTLRPVAHPYVIASILTVVVSWAAFVVAVNHFGE